MALALLDVDRAVAVARQLSDSNPQDPRLIRLMERMAEHKRSLDPEMTAFSALCDRWDNLYWPQGFTAGGASHWSHHESAWQSGRSHISDNVYPVYVDVPASLQSVPPIENMVTGDQEPESRTLAATTERVYFAWKDKVKFEFKSHQACVVKGLYGRTAAKVWWDQDGGYPQVEVIDNPRNLYLGYSSSQYNRLDWAMYTYAISPSVAMEDWGLRVESIDDGKGGRIPYVQPSLTSFGDVFDSWLVHDNELRVEVYDYWYRRPIKGAQLRFGKPTAMETWNAIFVGNVLVKNQRHPEYRGAMPFVPLFNTYIPGHPTGRPELYDIEQMIREKDEKLSENSQMISKAILGQAWQLTGENAPDVVPDGVEPVPNRVTAPGAGNRIEKIEPWMPEFQMDQYLDRIDRELADVSGLNDLLRGMAPSSVLSSSKAIASLVANYETRIRMKRDLFYEWRVKVWELAAQVWGAKSPEVRPVLVGDEAPRLVLKAPSLTPRDDAEVAQMALNLVSGKVWSLARAQDATGVDDPESEQDIIRDEQTDATLNPQAVQVMAQLMGILQSMGIQPQQELADMAQAQAGALNDVRQLQGGQQAFGPSMNGAGEQPIPPEQVGGVPPQAGAPMPSTQDLTLQTAIRDGQANSRILQQQQIETQDMG